MCTEDVYVYRTNSNGSRSIVNAGDVAATEINANDNNGIGVSNTNCFRGSRWGKDIDEAKKVLANAPWRGFSEEARNTENSKSKRE